MSRKDSHASRSSSKKPRQSVPKSSSCDGLRMADARFEKLCASSGISVPLKQYARSRNVRLASPVSRFLNWSLCLTSVEERLAPRSRVSACLELAARWVPAQTMVLRHNPAGATLSGRTPPKKHSLPSGAKWQQQLCLADVSLAPRNLLLLRRRNPG